MLPVFTLLPIFRSDIVTDSPFSISTVAMEGKQVSGFQKKSYSGVSKVPNCLQYRSFENNTQLYLIYLLCEQRYVEYSTNTPVECCINMSQIKETDIRFSYNMKIILQQHSFHP